MLPTLFHSRFIEAVIHSKLKRIDEFFYCKMTIKDILTETCSLEAKSPYELFLIYTDKLLMNYAT